MDYPDGATLQRASIIARFKFIYFLMGMAATQE